MSEFKYKHLTNVDSPVQLRELSPSQLKEYCDELRHFIIESLAENPGHLASSLGTVELSAALHYTFDTPSDKIIWDVGHQAYAHKIITGRREMFHTNRKLGGLSGFPKISESQYDAFGGGHTSVSISAALGVAEALKIKGEDRLAVAIIGDGALTGGLAFEGLNNAGASNANLLVVLNDNDMSIDANVGAMRQYLLSITTSYGYNKLKKRAWEMLENTPAIRRFVRKVGRSIKQSLLQRSNLFESLNFRYFGPIDGHDVVALSRVLADLKSIKGPKLLHVLTVKGKGYKPAESNQLLWHAPGRFNWETGEIEHVATPEAPKYQDVFGLTLLELAHNNKQIVGITPAMPSGSSLNMMMEQMPERCFDVGIAEGHAVTFSAGLATEGMIPFCNIYSSFMQRAYDNVIHDVALQNLGVVFCLDRAGVVGEDGPTHHGAFDIAYFRPIPNMIISAPMDERELRNLMYTAAQAGSPFVIRYPRGRGVGADMSGKPEKLEIGRARKLCDGSQVAILSIGHVGNFASKAIEQTPQLSVAHYDMRFAKPLDEELLHEIGAKFKHVITIEDGVVMGGMGSGVIEFMDRHGYDCRVEMMGIGDNFVEHGKPSELHHLCGYDTQGIIQKLHNFL